MQEFVTEKSRQMHEETKKYIVDGVGSSFHIPHYAKYPIAMTHGKGSKLYDVDGNEYIDYMMGMGPIILGHSNEVVNKAVADQLAKGTQFSAPTQELLELGKELTKIIPCAEIVSFQNSGTEVDMYAMRLVRAYTNRWKIVKFEGQYHGWADEEKISIEADTIEELGPREKPYKIIHTKGQRPSSADDLIVMPWNDLEALEKLFSEQGNEIAAVLKKNHLKLPVGKIKRPHSEIMLTYDAEFKNIGELKQLEVTKVPGKRVYLGDVAEIRLQSQERRQESFLNGKQGVSLDIIKKADANSVKVIEAAKAKFDELRRTPGALPGGMELHCARRWGHGYLALREALRDSCNTFFCNLGCEVGTNQLCKTARAFGLGAKTGIDTPDEVAGVVPTHEWKMRTYGERWYPGDLAQMAMGQGMLLASPLQMARVAGALGRGMLVTPRLRADASAMSQALPFPKEHLDIVREGMRMVVEKGGTGARGAEGVNAWMIGKTGTAEVGRGATRRKNTWFIAYAESCGRDGEGRIVRVAKPAEVVAVAMVIENGMSGGGTTAPRVAEVLKGVFGSTDG